MEKVWVKYDRGTNPLEVLKVVQKNNVWKLTREELYNVLDKNDIHFFMVDDEIKLMMYSAGVKVTGVFGYGEKARVEDEYLIDLKNKLALFKDNREYMEKVNNLIAFAPIYEKYENDEELTKEDLEFVYQVKREVKAFTGATEEKMNEIIDSRDEYEDIASIFGIETKEVAIGVDDIDENTIALKGNLIVNEDNAEDIEGIKYVIGHVYLENKKLKKYLRVQSCWTIEEL